MNGKITADSLTDKWVLLKIFLTFKYPYIYIWVRHNIGPVENYGPVYDLLKLCDQ